MKITHIAIAAIIGLGLGVAHQHANATTCEQYADRIEFLAEHRDNGMSIEEANINIKRGVIELTRSPTFEGVDMAEQYKDWMNLLMYVYGEPRLEPHVEAAAFMRACRNATGTHKEV